jgi:mannose-1-phosphate guanylyltransferase
MKAFLLAAGLGTRLRPLTDTTPKCMLPIDGRPMLEIWLDSLQKAGADEVLLNLHHLPDVVTGYLEGRRGGPKVTTVFEPELLGSAGTLMANREWAEDEDFFLVCYADNLTDFDLSSLVAAHRAHAPAATWALFRTEYPTACGIVELDSDNNIVGFVEKPAQPVSNLANAGLYAFDAAVLSELSGPPPQDIGFNLLPRLVGRSKGLLVDGYFRDVGTPGSYARAQEDWAAKARP